ncbi:MAG: aminoglycoside phosphotransferase family protein [Alphaproteobacteria bacterium]|nr:aminoglycoside phosphotransferase family protein [Alphaproteobacteria bacterium]
MSAPTASDVAMAMRTVAEIEGRIPELAAPDAAREFRRIGRVLLASRFLARLLSPRPDREAWGRVRATSRLGRVKIAVALPLAPRIAAPVKADLVIVKNGIRAVYADRPFTLKIADPRKTGASYRLRQEIAARRRLVATAEIDVPTLFDTGQSPTSAFLVETFVLGTRHERNLPHPERFAAQLFRFHIANGACIRPISEAIDMDAEWRRFRDGAAALGYRTPPGLDSLVADAGNSGILHGLCHGDLSAENLLAHPGDRWTILDWEYARDDPIFTDVAKLAVGNPSFGNQYCAEADAWVRGQDGRALVGVVQLALGAMVAVNRRADWIAESADRAAAIRTFRRKADRFIQLIATALRADRAGLDNSAPPARR